MERQEAPAPGVIASWAGLLRRRWLAGVVTFVVVAATVAAVLVLTRPLFRADARLRLGEPPPTGGVSPTAGFIGLLRLGGDPFANDLELLSSRTVAEHIVEDVALHAKLDAPKGWFRDSLFSRFDADRTTHKATYEIAWEDEGKVSVDMVSPRDSAIARAAPGEEVTFDGVRVVPRPWRPGMPARVRIATEPFDDVARRMSGRLQLERTRREANVLEIIFEHTDPGVTRQAVAAAVRRFVTLRAQVLARESSETVDSLRAVAGGTVLELKAAEDALENWQRESRLISPEIQSEVFVERYGEAIRDLEMSRIEYGAIDSVLQRLEREPEPSRAWVTLLAYPRFLENETVGTLLSRMSDLEEERLELETRRAESSREAGVLRGQIAALDASLRELASGYRTALAERVLDLEAQVSDMDLELSRVPGNAVELMRRQRDVRLLSELVVLTEQRLRQEELRQALTFSNVQVIDPPQLRRRQVWPRPKLGAAVGLLLAGTLGLLAMVAAETADPTARTAAQLRVAAAAPVLATPIRHGRRTVRLMPRDAAAIAAVAKRQNAASLTLSPVARANAEGVAEALETADMPLPPLAVTTDVTEFGAASNAASAPVLLVAERRRTRRHEVAAAASRVREAGGDVLGVILICESERAARSVWV